MTIENDNADLPLLTASRQRAYRQCPRQHHLRYERGIVPARDGEALYFGSAVHKALEAWWLQHQTPDPQTDALTRALAALPVDLDAYDRARAEAMLCGYDARWSGWAAGVEVIGAECEFRSPLRNPETGAASRTWQLAGKLDALVRLADGRIAVIEHKTASEDAGPGSVYRSRLLLDGQVSQYLEGVAALGYPTDLVVYDVLRKPAVKPLRATPPDARKYTKAGALYAGQREADETPDEYRARCAEAIAADPEGYLVHVEVVRLEEERAEYRFDVWQLARTIRESELAHRAPRNPDGCWRYGSACPYWDACTGTASLDDETRFRKVESVNPELSQPRPQVAA